MEHEIYLARYIDNMYPEDNEIFGAYKKREEAQERIEVECAYYCGIDKSAQYHKANIKYYEVTEVMMF